MLKFLKREANTAYTANGAVSDIRGGMGERRAFRVILKYLAQNYPETVIKNIGNIAEYGRYDDILSLMDTACEQEAVAYIKAVLKDDMKSMQAQDSVSLMAKWLPSVNASSKETVRLAKKIAKAMNMSDASYRRMLSALRAYIKILENNLREKDYTFSYEKQPSKALFKYRKAFFRNDEERYSAFISKAVTDPSVMKTGSLTPYDIVNTIIRNRGGMASSERNVLDATWNALENYVNSDNTLAVVDGSGSMYCSCFATQPAAVAESLGIYFAERNKGAFANCFITFSANPRLVEIKGDDIFEKVKYCMSYNECSNTNIEKTFDLILNTAVKNRLKQKDMPSRLMIISDMEFDCCASDASMTNFEAASMTNFEAAKAKFAKKGYKLPQVVFWNVNSFNRQQPVRMNDRGAILVSGMSPQIFAMLKEDKLDPYSFMMSVISSERYERVAA